MTVAVAQDNEAIEYPQTRRGQQVDTLHGTKVEDPYRWLEEDVRDSKEVADWVAAQNKITFKYLEGLDAREPIEARLKQLWNYERYSSPFKAGKKYYYFKNDGLQNQSVLYQVDSLDGEAKVLVDPNSWSKDGTTALGDTSFSPNGRYMAFSIQEAGSDWRVWKVMDVDSGKELSDKLQWIKFSHIAWTRDNRGFFYSRFDQPKEGQAFQSLNLNQKVYYHRLGSDQSEDVLVFQRPDQPQWGFSSQVTEDGSYLVITVWKGTDNRYRVLIRDLREAYAMPVEIIPHFKNDYSFIGNDGSVFYFKTDWQAPRGRVIAIDYKNPQKDNWQEVIPQGKHTLRDVELVGNLFVAKYLKDAHSMVKVFSMDGTFVRTVKLPGIGSVSGFQGRRGSMETFYSYSSFTTPSRIYHYNLLTGKSTLFKESKVDFKPDEYNVEQVFFKSKDGTSIPMFLAYKGELKKDGQNPTLLYGYGGFNIPLTPSFSVARLAWMELGGVFALANLRGGGEYGEEWHRAGTKLRKQNVFDDFIGAAEHLIAEKVTSAKKIAIQGGSNGGLLVGACMAQRPELFGACLPAVGVMDMLRFHLFTAGRYWVDDYGSAREAEEFKALLSYSPYHNLKKGTHYPPTLVTTADTDDRVVPSHSFKFAAALQYAQGGKAPVLIRIETKAGHGAGKPTQKWIEEISDKWAFLVKNLGMPTPKSPSSE